MLGSAGPALAEKLVVFKNGKSIRVRTLKEDKGWTRLEIDGGVMAVRSFQVARVDEVTGGGGKSDIIPNQALVGGGGVGAPSPAYAGARGADVPEPQPEESQQVENEEAQQPPQPGVSIPGAAGRRPGQIPGVNTRGAPRFGGTGGVLNNRARGSSRGGISRGRQVVGAPQDSDE